MKILVTNSWIARHIDEIRDDFPAVEFVIPDGEADTIAAAADAEVAFGSVTAALLAAAPGLKWVHAASAGVEWMPPELAATDIVVTNTRGGAGGWQRAMTLRRERAAGARGCSPGASAWRR